MTTTVKLSGQTLFRHRDFMLLWGGQTVSQIGTQVTILALPLVAIVALIRNREPRTTRARDRPRPGFRSQLGEWIAYVLHDPILRKTVAWSGTANFFVVMVEPLGPVYLIRNVHLRPAYVGLLLAMGAAGGVIAGSLSGALARRIGSAQISWLSMTVFTLPGLLIPMARPGWWVLQSAMGWMSWTFGSTLCGVAVTSYQQATCPAELRGRVSGAARWVNWGTLPLGGLAAGALGSALGAHVTLWIAVIGGCLSGLWLYFSPLRHMRDMPTERLQPAGSLT